jgi:Zn-finger nucleic acid-binding protein
VKCPVCQKHRLRRAELEKGLSALICEECSGIWISHAQYLRWLEKGGPELAEEVGEAPLPLAEPDTAKLCPECGFILTRYRFWPEIEFHLDRCAHCGSVWFDQNEWEVLKQQDLHDRVHLFFTAPWQSELRREAARRRMDEIYLKRFGEQLYSEIKRLRRWVDEHPRRAEVLAFLNDPDPYAG